jgi:hypothetical protein
MQALVSVACQDVRSFETAETPDESVMRKRHSFIKYCTAIKLSSLISPSKRFPSTALHYFDPDIAALGDHRALRQFAATIVSPSCLIFPTQQNTHFVYRGEMSYVPDCIIAAMLAGL